MQSHRESSDELAGYYKHITVVFIPLSIHTLGIVWVQTYQNFKNYLKTLSEYYFSLAMTRGGEYAHFKPRNTNEPRITYRNRV